MTSYAFVCHREWSMQVANMEGMMVNPTQPPQWTTLLVGESEMKAQKCQLKNM